MRSPLRPVGVTVIVAGAPGGTMVREAVRVVALYDPLKATEVVAATADVVIENVARVAPAATVTDAGTFANAPFALESDTIAPPAGAADDSVTVPVDEAPPVSVGGESVSVASVGKGAGPGGGGAGGVMPNAANKIVSTTRAESCAVVPAEANVVTVNVVCVAPAGTVTEAGTAAAPGRLLDSWTTVPPAGAAEASATLPVAGVPPTTLAGLTLNADSVAAGGGVAGGVTVKSADRVTPPPVTETVTMVVCVTAAGRI